MKKRKEKTKVYVLMLSKEFPKYHTKAGQPTRFRCKFLMGREFSKACTWDCTYDGTENTRRSCSRNAIVENGKSWISPKIHTIRKNYDRWEKRIKAIQEGKAVLSIRQWSGRPYEKGNTQIEIARLGKDDGVGIQKLERDQMLGWFIDGIDSDVTTAELAKNDGLSFEDWKEWFKDIDLTEPLPIIHFTNFRYGKQK